MLTPHQLRMLGAHAGVDPRTARDIVQPAPERKGRQRSTTTARVLQSARELGFDQLLASHKSEPKP
jgi:hypothetical protein